MEINLISRTHLHDIPSASGIEFLNGHYFVIGDNSPWLYQLDKTFQTEQRIQIGSIDSLENEVEPKSRKKDLEAMCGFLDGGDSVILVIGSGSKSPIRDHAKMIRWQNDKPIVKDYDLFSFFDYVKKKAKLDDDEFNLEAAAVLDDQLFMFNRGNNKIIQCSLKKFMSFLNGEIEADEVKLKVTKVELPEIEGIEAGFSGAASDEAHERILFTASVENTANWIDDGAVLGSFVGMIDLKDLSQHYKPKTVLLRDPKGVIQVKVESITLSQVQQGSLNCVLVTDSDGGESEILEVAVRIP
jgi:hypothetical protein